MTYSENEVRQCLDRPSININDIDEFKSIIEKMEEKTNFYNSVGITIKEIMENNNTTLTGYEIFNGDVISINNEKIFYNNDLDSIYKFYLGVDEPNSRYKTIPNVIEMKDIYNPEKKEVSAIGIILKYIHESLAEKDDKFKNYNIYMDVNDQKTFKEKIVYLCASRLLVPYLLNELTKEKTAQFSYGHKVYNDFKDLYITKIMNENNISRQMAEISLHNLNGNWEYLSQSFTLQEKWKSFIGSDTYWNEEKSNNEKAPVKTIGSKN